jgi:hypothetical protein
VARYLQLAGKSIEIPADGYPGEYMIEVAKRIRDESGDAYAGASMDDPPREMVLRGVDIMVEGIRDDIGKLGVDYDAWFRERSLYEAIVEGSASKSWLKPASRPAMGAYSALSAFELSIEPISCFSRSVAPASTHQSRKYTSCNSRTA